MLHVTGMLVRRVKHLEDGVAIGLYVSIIRQKEERHLFTGRTEKMNHSLGGDGPRCSREKSRRELKGFNTSCIVLV